MDITLCAQCGIEIEGMGIQFRGKTFCGDDCCELFEAVIATTSEPGLAELSSEDLEVDDAADDHGLGYREDADVPGEKDFDDDDYAIDPDDF